MNKEKVIEQIMEALAEIENHLETNELPLIGPESRDQLNQFKENFRKMIKLIDEKPIDSEESFTPMGRIILDSWPLVTSLGEKILSAEQAFTQYRKKFRNN